MFFLNILPCHIAKNKIFYNFNLLIHERKMPLNQERRGQSMENEFQRFPQPEHTFKPTNKDKHPSAYFN